MTGTERGYVTFSLDRELFALPLEAVSRIVRVTTITPVPRAAPCLRGVMNVAGAVIPVADLRCCCGLPAVDLTDASRVIVVDVGTPLGLVADRVLSVRTGRDVLPDAADAARTALGADLLAGVLHDGDALISLLDLDALVTRELRPPSRTTGAPVAAASPVAARSPGAPDAEDRAVQLVSFLVDAQECAVELDSVHEVLRAPLRPTPIPHAGPGVLGIMDLRRRPLPLFSLRSLLGASAVALDEAQRVLVTSVRGGDGASTVLVGLVADGVREVLNADRSDIRAMPDSVSEVTAVGVDEVCTLDDGRRLVPILNLERLLNTGGERVDNVLARAPREETMGEDSGEAAGRQFVAFRVALGEYGLDVEDVYEVARAPDDVVRLPDAPPFIAGVCTLHGTVLPLLDMRSRLGEEAAVLHDSARVLVTVSQGHQVGLLVDAVLDVRRVRSDHVIAPDSLTAENASFVQSMVRDGSGGRLMLVIDPSSLLDAATSEGLDREVAP